VRSSPHCSRWWWRGSRVDPQSERRTLLLLVAGCAITAPVIAFRYDPLPALVTALALLAVVDGRPGLGGVWIGLGIAIKLDPAVLLPGVVVWYVSGRRWDDVVRFAGAAVASATLVMLPFIRAAPGDVWSFLSYHAQRGVQIESIPGGIILLDHLIRGTPAVAVNRFGAGDEVAGRRAAAVTVTLVGARRARAAGRDEGHEPLIIAALVALLAFIVGNKVFSPQYLAWLLPFLPLADRRTVAIGGAVAVLTIALYPFAYDRLLALEPMAIALLNVRNTLVVVLLGWSVRRCLTLSRTPHRTLSS
jgi:hypothetical protein